MFGFRLSQQSLELGEDLLDRIEVGRVFGQEQEARPDGSDGLSHTFPSWEPRLSRMTTSPMNTNRLGSMRP
jgi:hypothetical protein